MACIVFVFCIAAAIAASAQTFTVLDSFDGHYGTFPDGSLVQGTDGNFYGTTYKGGGQVFGCGYSRGCGTVFSLSVGLGSFVETNPASGQVGAKVVILGNNLDDATSITLNGTAVGSFSVNASGPAITTTVPGGASTGTVAVKIPSGTLYSNQAFRVGP